MLHIRYICFPVTMWLVYVAVSGSRDHGFDSWVPSTTKELIKARLVRSNRRGHRGDTEIYSQNHPTKSRPYENKAIKDVPNHVFLGSVYSQNERLASFCLATIGLHYSNHKSFRNKCGTVPLFFLKNFVCIRIFETWLGMNKKYHSFISILNALPHFVQVSFVLP